MSGESFSITSELSHDILGMLWICSFKPLYAGIYGFWEDVLDLDSVLVTTIWQSSEIFSLDNSDLTMGTRLLGLTLEVSRQILLWTKLTVVQMTILSRIALTRTTLMRTVKPLMELELIVFIMVSYNYLLTDSERRNIIVFCFRCLDSWRMGWRGDQLSRSVQSHHWHHLLCWWPACRQE